MKAINTRGIASGFAKFGFILLLLPGCSPSQSTENILPEPKLYQEWQLKPGDDIAGAKVVGGLGDISIELNGRSVYAPSDGNAYLDKRGCVYFSGASTPGYLFRLCGLEKPKLGTLSEGDKIATGQMLQFATLLKQADNSWALVEPDKSLLQRTLNPR